MPRRRKELLPNVGVYVGVREETIITPIAHVRTRVQPSLVHLDSLIRRKALHFIRLFEAIKKEYTGFIRPVQEKDKRFNRYLSQCAQVIERLEMWRKKWGLQISDVDYIQAHIEQIKNRKSFNPGNLLSKNSYIIYQAYYTNKYTPTVELSLAKMRRADKRMVHSVMKNFGLSEEKVVCMLRANGLLPEVV